MQTKGHSLADDKAMFLATVVPLLRAFVINSRSVANEACLIRLTVGSSEPLSTTIILLVKEVKLSIDSRHCVIYSEEFQVKITKAI